MNSILQTANSGKTQAAIGSPKFTTVFGPFYKTELFFGAGMGYHSNDARSTTITRSARRPSDAGGRFAVSGALAGAEIGVRTKIVPGLDSSVSLFYLHQDFGAVLRRRHRQHRGRPAQPAHRHRVHQRLPSGVLAPRRRRSGALARPLSWVRYAQEQLYQSLAGFPQAQIGNAPGNFVYNAPWMVASAGITLGEKTGWFGALRWRYISSRPLTEDGVFQSPPVSIFNGQIGYRFANGWRIQLDALNLLNSHAPITPAYAYGSLLTTDSLFAMCFPAHGPPTAPAAVCQNGVMDYVAASDRAAGRPVDDCGDVLIRRRLIRSRMG